ncbi:2,3-dihydroxybenzoate-AMP ligase [Raoultella planticola]|uniref:2,3-dihydroxybenzoate-AMP ligase n=1 Tax=Raoultella planticola TaxID=575 RepID=A0A485CPQ4_RAOPL|nr:2,3-dihydroxybenzoate-AMP ligase [Raoultella planticola]
MQGREKDQINRGGEKIAAEEVENLLLRHPAVIHAALVSMEDSLLGEKSCAYLVVKEPLACGSGTPFPARTGRRGI